MSELIADFFPFPYKLGDSRVLRYFFVKSHEGTDNIKPSDRTLYILNVPQFFNNNCLKHIFSDFGAIDRIFIHSKPTSGEESGSTSTWKSVRQESDLGSKVAYVVFTKPAALKKVLKFKDVKIISPDYYESNVGTNKWIDKYNNSFVNAKELQQEINEFMSQFDIRIENEKQKEKEMTEEPDEEGWVTVSKYSKKPKIPRLEAVNTRLVAKQAAQQSKLSLMKFYKNQLRDAKMDQIVELRKKFEKDKAQIALMRQNRKFKPF